MTFVAEGTEAPFDFKALKVFTPLSLFIFNAFVTERSEALVRIYPEWHLKTYLAEGTEAPLAFKPFIFSSFVAERSEALSAFSPKGQETKSLGPKGQAFSLSSFLLL